MGEKAKARLVALDGLRGIAALAVLLGHTSERLFGYVVNPNMDFAVPYFFMLSGFILQHAYRDVSFTFPEIGRYLAHRTIRLFPLIIIGGLIGASVIVYRHLYADLQDVPHLHIVFAALSAVTTMPSPFLSIEGWHWPANYPAWSLFFELVASVAFPLFLARLGGIGLAAIVAASGIALSVIMYANAGIPAGLTGQAALTAFSFPLGILLYNKFYAAGEAKRSPMPYLIIPALFLFVPADIDWKLGLLLLALPLPLLMLKLSGEMKPGKMERLFAILGAISFPAYILHAPLTAVYLQFFDWVEPRWSLCAILLICIVVPTIAHYTIDQPVRRVLRTGFERWWMGRQAMPAGVTA